MAAVTEPRTVTALAFAHEDARAIVSWLPHPDKVREVLEAVNFLVSNGECRPGGRIINAGCSIKITNVRFGP
jgi:hypothetical protein